MPTVLITGANRGLGLEFVRQYAEADWNIVATCRKPENADRLHEVQRKFRDKISLFSLDVSQAKSFSALKSELKNKPIDLLISNAGVYGEKSRFGAVDYDYWLEAMKINTFSTLRLAETFHENISFSEKKLLVAITSLMGSIEDNTSGGSYVYRSTKAALNMVVKSLAVDLQPEGIICALLHPGWVQTDMGGPNASIDTSTSISGMRKVLEGLKLRDSGKFFNYEGEVIPW
ncbi:MAG: SDR family oxidoreductase [Bdellovibrionales bacterium]|nr:SDR family oxidoreductase [Bdellovibrionales bacterium]